MENFLKLIENDLWYRQFLYGLIMALFFGAVSLLSGFSIAWAIVQIAIIATVKEHYVQDLTGQFNWRNFFFLLVPVMLLYIIYTW